ncbi:MAG: putative basic amino acid antiporter YfcC [Firmicutes bacterium]|nr:putative basic amino acid antiporter YfcC [Bacillota bacterium]
MDKKKRKLAIPDVYILLFAIILICVVLSYIIPAGAYDMMEVDGREVVDPDSYHNIEQTPVSLMQMLSSITRGLQDSAQIVFFIFIIGGAMAVIQSTSVIEAGLGKLAKTLNGKDLIVIPVVLALVGIGGATFGLCEETITLAPIFVTLCLAMGYDSLVGVAIVMVGSSIGWAGEFMNPFCLQVAQNIAELPPLSGMGLRIALFVTMWIVTSLYIMRYAKKIKKEPRLSTVYEIDQNREDTLDLDHLPKFGGREIAILVVFIGMMVLLVYGVIELGWYMDEISALFLGASIICACIGRIGFNRYAQVLGKGMADIATGALVVGFAKAIVVVLTDGNILHVLLHGAASVLGVLPPLFSAIGMYIFQNLLNIIVVSGSGQAAISMPLMAPLADLVDVTRQTAVMALSIGNGISNVLTPVSGFLLAGLALAKVPYSKWVKWILPLIGIQFVVGLIFIIIAHVTGYGPF